MQLILIAVNNNFLTFAIKIVLLEFTWGPRLAAVFYIVNEFDSQLFDWLNNLIVNSGIN